MRDLIIVGVYCPDVERQLILNNCVESLQKGRDKYDILICSHTIIPEYIQRKVDYVFYDKNNDILTDLKYLNQPWFSPKDDITIKSTFIGYGSTYLAAYSILISGLGIAKNYKYRKAHFIEYDSIWNDLTPIKVNSDLLENYDSVVINKKPKDYDSNLYWGQGFFISFKVGSLDDDFLFFDRDKLLELLVNSPSKTNEKITDDILRRNGRKVFEIDYEDMVKYKNEYKISDKTEKESLSGWSVPYYNPKDNKIYVVCWNDRYNEPLTSSFIINDEKIIKLSGIKKFEWKIEEVGFIDDVYSISIMVNDKHKHTIKFSDEFKEDFKKTNYITIK